MNILCTHNNIIDRAAQTIVAPTLVFTSNLTSCRIQQTLVTLLQKKVRWDDGSENRSTHEILGVVLILTWFNQWTIITRSTTRRFGNMLSIKYWYIYGVNTGTLAQLRKLGGNETIKMWPLTHQYFEQKQYFYHCFQSFQSLFSVN